MSIDIETRRRRAAYRAHHRGTKEMDWLVGRYADAHLGGFDEVQLSRFEQFLEIADPELQRWLLDEAAAVGAEFATLVEDVRAFHGLARRDQA